MARINKKKAKAPTKTVEDELRQRPDATENMEGGLAFQMKAKTKLATMAATCMVNEPKFYKTEKDGKVVAQNQDHELIKLAHEVAKTDKAYVLKLAAFLRHELYMRTISTTLWVESVLATPPKTANPLVRKYAPSILVRADEPAEAIAYFIAKRGQLGDKGPAGVVLPHSMRKGIADAMHNFQRYHISKYDRVKADVHQRDVINVGHITPKDKEEETLYKDVLAKTLAPAETWEDTLMRWKDKGYKSKKEAWEAILPKMGVMAKLRNLRNVLEEDISKRALDGLIAYITKPEVVHNSKLFPIRYYTAWKSIQGMDGATELQAALEKALDISMDNLPVWDDITMLSCDWSQSMESKMSDKSVITNKEIGALLMCMATKLCKLPIATIFADTLAMVQAPDNMNGRIIESMNQLMRHNIGSSTNAWLCLDYLNQHKTKVKRWVCLSDCQCYNSYSANKGAESVASLWRKYKERINPNAFMYSIDLAGYGTSMVPEDDPGTCLLAGWSDRVLEFVPMFETTGQTLVSRIESIDENTYRKKPEEKRESEQEEIPAS